jgi:hypothetical protein
MIKSNRMRWEMLVACMGEKRDTHRISVGKPEGKISLGDLVVDGRIILSWILREIGRGVMGWSPLGQDRDQ